MNKPETHMNKVACVLLGFILVNWSVWHEGGYNRARVTMGKHDGFMTKVFVDTDGSRHTYLAFVPFSSSGEKHRPGILYLNGLGERGTDGLSPIVENMGSPVWEMKRRFPFVIIAPQSPPKDGSWLPNHPHFDLTLRLLKHAIREFDVDPDRIALIGVSSGAREAFTIADGQGDEFSAVVTVSPALSSYPTPQQIANSLSEKRIPIWNVFNRFDGGKLSELNRELKCEFLARGRSPYYFEFNATGHDAWNRGLRSPALFEWLLQQNRLNPRTKRFRLIDLSELDAEFEPRGGISWTIQGAKMDAVAHSPAATDVESVLISRVASQQLEMHAEFRADPGSEFGFVLSTDGSDEEQNLDWRIVLCDALLGSGGVMTADGGAFVAALEPLAQRAIEQNDWNDVRIQCDGSRLTVLINGWTAIELTDNRLTAPKKIGFWQGTKSSRVTEWRWIRVINSTKPNENHAENEQ